MHVLLIEDESDLGREIRNSLVSSGHHVIWKKDGEEGKKAAENNLFDIILLDLNIPRLLGLEVLHYLRKKSVHNQKIPILIITASDEVDIKVEGLNAGADDYLVKPFEMAELEARIMSVHRRQAGLPSNLLIRGNLEMDIQFHTVLLDQKQVELSPREFVILQKLLENQGRIISKEILLNSLYKWQNEAESNVIEVHIHHLRKKFGDDFIQTKRGIGYSIEKLTPTPPSKAAENPH